MLEPNAGLGEMTRSAWGRPLPRPHYRAPGR